MKQLFATTRAKVITGVLAIFVLLAIAAGSVFAYFGSHALPGTTVAGQDVGGQTRDQVEATLKKLVDQQVVTVERPDGTVSDVDFVQAGVFVEVGRTTDRVFEDNAGFANRVNGLFKGRNIEPVVVTNYAQLDNYVNALEYADAQNATDAEVHYDPDLQTFVVTESVEGEALATEALEESILEAAASMTNTTIKADVVAFTPEYETEVATAAASTANTWIRSAVEVGNGEGSVIQADPSMIASWVSFTAENGTITPSLNREAITAWVDTFAQESNQEAVTGVQNVTQSGRVVAVSREGRPGRSVDNTAAVSDAVAAAVESGTSFVGEFTYATIEATYEQRVVADGAENLAYMAAPGEKWIDINLSSHTVTAYEGATTVMSMPMIAGAPQTPTLPGTFAIYAKIPTQTMRGLNVDGTKYETPNVPWILYYDGNYALHGAPWRGGFGYNAGDYGSHGCVNLPADSAKKLYDWASINDRVVVHN